MHHVNEKIYRACFQSVLTYGTETWVVKAKNPCSLEKAIRMMTRWMYDVIEG